MAEPRKLKLGETLLVKVDPRTNNGSSEAAAHVVRVLNVEDEQRVNLRVLLDDPDTRVLRNVPVLAKRPSEDDEDAPFVWAVRG